MFSISQLLTDSLVGHRRDRHAKDSIRRLQGVLPGAILGSYPSVLQGRITSLCRQQLGVRLHEKGREQIGRGVGEDTAVLEFEY